MNRSNQVKAKALENVYDRTIHLYAVLFLLTGAMLFIGNVVLPQAS